MTFPYTEVAPIVSSFLDTAARHATKNSIGELTYLEMVEKPASTSEGFAELSLVPQKKVIDIETFRYTAKCNPEIIKNLESIHGVNYVKNTASALYNEMVNTTELKLYDTYKEAGKESQNTWLTNWQVWCNKKFGITYPKYIDITEEGFTRKLHATILTMCNKVAVKSRRGPANFLVGNSQIISYIMDMSGFTPFIKRDKTEDEGTITCVGSLGDIKVFANPNANWTDNVLVMGRTTTSRDPGVHFIEHDKTVNAIVDLSGDAKVILSTRQSMVNIGSTYKNTYLTRTLEFRKPPFWKKLFKLIVS